MQKIKYCGENPGSPRRASLGDGNIARAAPRVPVPAQRQRAADPVRVARLPRPPRRRPPAPLPRRRAQHLRAPLAELSLALVDGFVRGSDLGSRQNTAHHHVARQVEEDSGARQ